MYYHSSSRNGSDQGYYYRDNRYDQETNETHIFNTASCMAASPPTENYYSYATMPQQFSSGYSVEPPLSPISHLYTTSHNPLAIAHQTDQTLTAIASVRRRSKEYAKDSSNMTSQNRSPYSSQHHQARLGDPSDPYIMRSLPLGMTSPHLGATSPRSGATSPASTGPTKSAEGHACRSCGKVFGRPSALKIHMAIHTGEKAYICPEAGCHRCFSVRSNMNRHIRNVHQIWPDGHGEASDSSGDEIEC